MVSLTASGFSSVVFLNINILSSFAGAGNYLDFAGLFFVTYRQGCSLLGKKIKALILNDSNKYYFCHHISDLFNNERVTWNTIALGTSGIRKGKRQQRFQRAR